MCGIIAITGKNISSVENSVVQNMLSCLAQRGPDDQGFTRQGDSVLGQTRLSIVDLAGGHQPMVDNKHPFTLVFNGEIYGYKELRESLKKKGYDFSTESDTELILKAYAEYGADCVKYLDGMFAFALWDDTKKELFVARDRFGKKPLYYTFQDGLFFAASEIKSIFATGFIKGRIDPDSIDDYLRLGYIPSHKTIYSNIGMMAPAQAGIVKNGELKTWTYWKLEKKELNISYDEAKIKIKELFDAAVKKRMIADVEIGSLLSGGVDSTLVTLYAQKYSKSPIKTFSVGYEGSSSELPYALEASRKIGTEQNTLHVDINLRNELEKVISYMDEPHADTSNFPQHLISELASTKVKVALTGDGADELFMGYGWYQKKWHTPRWRLDWRLLSDFKAQQKVITVFSRNERKKLIKTPVTSTEKNLEDKITRSVKNSLEKINIFDISIYLPGQLLSKIDRTSMMHSLEIRSPFLDTALVEFVYNLPTKFKISKTENKIILKDILTETFPKEFVYRRKQGFGAPVKKWLKSDTMKTLLHEKFTPDATIFTYLKKEEIENLITTFYDKGDDSVAHKIWVILCLELWFNKHKIHHV